MAESTHGRASRQLPRLPLPSPDHRFPLSFRDVEDLLAECGITVSLRDHLEMVSEVWSRVCAPTEEEAEANDIWYLDEMFIRINGKRHYLWRAVDQEGDTIDILVQHRRDARAAKRFFRKLLKQAKVPRGLVTDNSEATPPLTAS